MLLTGRGPADNGTYTVRLNSSQVRDIAGNYAAATTIGTFQVGLFTAPGAPQLANEADSGTSSSDGITNFDNSTAAKAPTFWVPNTLNGGVVTIYADGVAIGSAASSGGLVAVFADGKTTIPNGTRTITAREGLAAGGPGTTDSPPLSITIDTAAPRVVALSVNGSQWQQPFVERLGGRGPGVVGWGAFLERRPLTIRTPSLVQHRSG